MVLLSASLALGACNSKSNDQPKENEIPVHTSATKGKILEPEMLINQNEASELLGEAVETGEKKETKTPLCLLLESALKQFTERQRE